MKKKKTPIGHTSYSWGLTKKTMVKKKRKKYDKQQFENVKYRRELNDLFDKYERDMKKKNNLIIQLRKKIQIQKGRIHTLKLSIDRTNLKLTKKELAIQSEKKLLTHEYAQQKLIKLRNEIKNMSLNIEKKLVKNELENTLDSIMMLSDSDEDDDDKLIKEKIIIYEKEEEWKIRSLLNAFKRCTPIGHIKKNKDSNSENRYEDSELYQHINNYLATNYMKRSKKKRNDKKTDTTVSVEKTEKEINKLLNSYSSSTDQAPSSPSPPNINNMYPTPKNYELENSYFAESNQSHMQLLKAEIEDDNMERTLYMEIEKLKNENLDLKQELIHKEEEYKHRLRRMYEWFRNSSNSDNNNDDNDDDNDTNKREEDEENNNRVIDFFQTT